MSKQGKEKFKPVDTFEGPHQLTYKMFDNPEACIAPVAENTGELGVFLLVPGSSELDHATAGLFTNPRIGNVGYIKETPNRTYDVFCLSDPQHLNQGTKGFMVKIDPKFTSRGRKFQEFNGPCRICTVDDYLDKFERKMEDIDSLDEPQLKDAMETMFKNGPKSEESIRNLQDMTVELIWQFGGFTPEHPGRGQQDVR